MEWGIGGVRMIKWREWRVVEEWWWIVDKFLKRVDNGEFKFRVASEIEQKRTNSSIQNRWFARPHDDPGGGGGGKGVYEAKSTSRPTGTSNPPPFPDLSPNPPTLVSYSVFFATFPVPVLGGTRANDNCRSGSQRTIKSSIFLGWELWDWVFTGWNLNF